MIRLHREGIRIVTISTLMAIALVAMLSMIQVPLWIFLTLSGGLTIALIIIYRFFRDPKRQYVINQDAIIAPADGVIVAIEEVAETEYFNETRKVVSIFMSIHNVHINWFPISGTVKYFKYHPGKYLLARHPKSSELNERTSIVIGNDKQEILVRQIAGYVARRIICYAGEGRKVKQSHELGFIRFGSRVDIFLPPETQLKLKIGDKTIGGVSEIA
jgi:phosphatidylserine decarboxylase